MTPSLLSGDSDEETDFSKMDMGNKKGPVGRYDLPKDSLSSLTVSLSLQLSLSLTVSLSLLPIVLHPTYNGNYVLSSDT